MGPASPGQKQRGGSTGCALALWRQCNISSLPTKLKSSGFFEVSLRGACEPRRMTSSTTARHTIPPRYTASTGPCLNCRLTVDLPPDYLFFSTVSLPHPCPYPCPCPCEIMWNMWRTTSASRFHMGNSRAKISIIAFGQAAHMNEYGFMQVPFNHPACSLCSMHTLHYTYHQGGSSVIPRSFEKRLAATVGTFLKIIHVGHDHEHTLHSVNSKVYTDCSKPCCLGKK